jgi:hypothetical protein
MSKLKYIRMVFYAFVGVLVTTGPAFSTEPLRTLSVLTENI